VYRLGPGQLRGGLEKLRRLGDHFLGLGLRSLAHVSSPWRRDVGRRPLFPHVLFPLRFQAGGGPSHDPCRSAKYLTRGNRARNRKSKICGRPGIGQVEHACLK
jgi:hypothetical protein